MLDGRRMMYPEDWADRHLKDSNTDSGRGTVMSFAGAVGTGRIGLALSGGGFRATVFHLGVLSRLAVESRLEDISFLSSVSGGSLTVGLLLALNDLRWPTSGELSGGLLSAARRLLLTEDLQRSLLLRTAVRPWRLLGSRAGDLSEAIQRKWGLRGWLNALPERPRWMINATCYETGKNWRFERFRMGDYLFGYTNDTNLPLADALAASAGFPGLIGPLVLPVSGRKWFRYRDQTESGGGVEADGNDRLTEPVKPAFDPVHLWDGGVYDNHGLEGLHDFITGWRADVDFFIVSDGAGRSRPERYRRGAPALLRLVTGIMMDQIRSLRARAIIERFVNHGDEGGFLRIGNSCRHILTAANRSDLVEATCGRSLNEAQAAQARDMPTMIRRLTAPEFNLLYRHGFEVADTTLHAYYPRAFGLLGFAAASM
jgi:NTE family protein